MNKHKIFTGVLLGYLVSLILLILTILVCAFLEIKILEILIIIFIAIVIIGYILVTILKIKMFQYKCSVCQHVKNISFGESIFASRADSSRLLKCPHCNADTYMERIAK